MNTFLLSKSVIIHVHPPLMASTKCVEPLSKTALQYTSKEQNKPQKDNVVVKKESKK